MKKFILGKNNSNLNHFDEKKQVIENIMKNKQVSIHENDYEEYKEIINLVGEDKVKIVKN